MPVLKVPKKEKKNRIEIPGVSKKIGRPQTSNFTKEHKELMETYELPKPLESFKRAPNSTKPKPTSKGKTREIDFSKEFGCELCAARFSTNASLGYHLTTYHFDHYDCLYCKEAYTLDQAEKFKMHMFKHEHNLIKGTSSTCVQCGKYFRFAGHLQEHVKARGQFHDDQCAQCERRFTTHQDYKNHVRDEHNGVWKLKCGHCNVLHFDDQVTLKAHIADIHLGKSKNKEQKKKEPQPDKVCEECGKHVRDLNGHVEQVHRDYKLPCPNCDHHSKNKYALKRHIEWFHDEIPCDMCGVMIGKSRMSYHLSSKHTSIYNRKFKCDICGKGFSDKTKLSDHNNVHTGEKPFKCKFCNASFANRGTHAMHQRSHLGHRRSK